MNDDDDDDDDDAAADDDDDDDDDAGATNNATATSTKGTTERERERVSESQSPSKLNSQQHMCWNQRDTNIKRLAACRLLRRVLSVNASSQGEQIDLISYLAGVSVRNLGGRYL